MNSLGESNVLLAVGWAVFNSLWQMAILWVAYQFITTVFRINKSSRKSVLAASLLFSGFVWFAFTLIGGLTGTGEGAQGYTALMNIDINSELGTWFSTMLPIASILYMVLLILPVLNFIRNYRYVQVIRRYGLSRAGVEWRMFVQKTASRMGIRKQVNIWMSELITSPVTIGYIKPIILLPLAAVNHLSTRQIEAVLLHELAHIRRYDYFINLLTRFIQTILYFNPFVKAFAKIIEREREKSCDQTVMQFQYEPHGYASALLTLEKAAHVARHSLAVAASDGKKSEFRQRIEWILGVHKKPVFSFQRLAGVMAALLLFIAFNAFVIVSKPAKNTGTPDSFTLLSLPLEFSLGDDLTRTSEVAENHRMPVTNYPSHEVLTDGQPVPDEVTEEEVAEEPVELILDKIQATSPYQFVFDLKTVMPTLNAIEEKQVQKVVNESKRVIQELKWKEVEIAIADALTTAEKIKAEAEVKSAIASISTQNLENKLRLAYDHIDWNQVNLELRNELTKIKMDSLHQVYTITLNNLCELKKELVNQQQTSIPDTDITLQSIGQQMQEVQKAIKKIETAKPKKVIRL